MPVEPETRLRAARFEMYRSRQFMGDLVSRFELVDVGHDVEQIAADEFGNLYFNGELDGTSYGSCEELVSVLSQVVTEVVFNDAKFVSAYDIRGDTEVWETDPRGTPRNMVSSAGVAPKDWETAVAEANDFQSADREAAHEYVEEGRVDELSAAPLSTTGPVLDGIADQYASTSYSGTEEHCPDYLEKNLEFGDVMDAIESFDYEYTAYLLSRCSDMTDEEFGDRVEAASLGDFELLKVLTFSGF